MSELAKKTCIHCKLATAPLSASEFKPLLVELNGWTVVENHHLSKTFNFPDFVTALAFVNTLGELAEGEGHHPDIYLAWGKVRVDIWTHSVDGLTESDFVLAAKTDQLG